MVTNTLSLVNPSGVEKELGETIKVFRSRYFYNDFQEGDEVNITDKQNRVINVARVTGLTDNSIELVITA